MKKLKKLNYFNITILITIFISSFILIHDFTFYGFIPMLKGKAYIVTYFGLFVDFMALCLLEISIQYMKDWNKKNGTKKNVR